MFRSKTLQCCFKLRYIACICKFNLGIFYAIDPVMTDDNYLYVSFPYMASELVTSSGQRILFVCQCIQQTNNTTFMMFLSLFVRLMS